TESMRCHSPEACSSPHAAGPTSNDHQLDGRADHRRRGPAVRRVDEPDFHAPARSAWDLLTTTRLRARIGRDESARARYVQGPTASNECVTQLLGPLTRPISAHLIVAAMRG